MKPSPIPDRLAHGFLELSKLNDFPASKVRCYASNSNHLGFTVFGRDEQSSVYVQMYKLPQASKQLKDDLAFQTKPRGWGKAPEADSLKLSIFPATWIHAVFADSPRRIVHEYKSNSRALFIRYIGKSDKHPLLTKFNKNLRYLPNAWRTSAVDHEFSAVEKPVARPPAKVRALDLRAEQQKIRKLILAAVKRFAANQRARGSDVYQLPISGIILFFDVGNGYASIHFDVRVPFENDGAYSHQEFGALPRENWRQLVEFCYAGNPVTITSPDGKIRQISSKSDFDFDKSIGAMILEVLKTLQAQKAFSPLLTHPRAELLIESDDGAFAWPARYKDRGKENRL